MAIRIKNFKKFQHFKDRNPPWVKLYRDLLDSPDWHELDPEAAKVLVMLWLIASEDEAKQGSLPDMKTLAFRLRIDQKHLEKLCIKLSQWLVHDDVEMMSPRHQVDAPETETEVETKLRSPSASKQADEGFALFWDAYGKKTGKQNAISQWKKIRPDAELLNVILQAAKVYAGSNEPKFRKDPERWLKERRWEDEAITTSQQMAKTEQASIFTGAI